VLTAALIAPWFAVIGVLVAWHLDQKSQDRQMADLLARISTEPRIELRRTQAPAQVELGQRHYIADHEADDTAWNEYRGEPEADAE
jgi:hypothetical protein